MSQTRHDATGLHKADLLSTPYSDGETLDARALLAAIVDSTDDAIVSKSLDGTILSWNSGAERLFGYSAAEAIGRSITLIIPAELQAEERAILQRLRRGERIEHFETVRVSKQGTRIDISLTISPVRDAHGRIIGASKIARDVTQRKRADEALRDETRIAETLNRVGRTLSAELDVERIVQFVTDEATAVTSAEFGAFFYDQIGEDGEPHPLYALSGASRDALHGFPMARKTALFGPTFDGTATVRIDDVTLDARYGRNDFHDGMPPGQLPVRSYLSVPVVSRSGEVLGGLLLGHQRTGIFTERHERIVSGIAAQAAITLDNASLYGRVQESEQRFRQLAEHATDVFWIVAIPERRMLYVSPAYEEVWGRTCQSLYDEPLTFLDAVHPEDRDCLSEAMQRQLEGHTTAVEYRLVHGDGSLRWVWDRGFPIRNDAGEVVRVAGIAEDITERKVAEERVRDSEERYRRLTELLPVAVYTCEAPSGTISFFNERAAELWGRTPSLQDPTERFCGSARMYLPNGDPLPHEECPMAAAIREGRGFRNQEVVVERPDGSRITALVNIEPIFDAQGRVVAAINACLDVSALKEAEQRLKEADRRKDEFLATLSHELRNPLAPLRYALEIIEQARDDGDLLRQSRHILERQVEQMVRLVDDLLDVSRITHDKLELCLEVVRLDHIVEQALETCRPLIESARHTLVVDLPEETVNLSGDAVRLIQVVGNLVGNACKYTSAGGRIEISAARRGNDVLLSVRDNGQGIPRHDLDRIFEMFTQADRTADRYHGGLGVGLTLVKRLVEMHGGSVRAESEGPGQGSTFVVRLPIVENAQSLETPARASNAEGSATCRVLVVDDNRDAAASLSVLLDIAGYETLTAHDGPEAIEAAEWFRPDVVLLDLGLPSMDGYEVCRAIRHRPWGRDVTLVALTGWGQEEDRRRSREAGFDEHLVKPVDHTAIERLLRARADAAS